MFVEAFKLADYCERIHYTGDLQPDFATLKGLMQQHLQHIPFENLNVLAGKVISLEPSDIIDKLIYQQRGGYCYEMNGLFTMALSALGIDYAWVAARPRIYPHQSPRTHAALIVNIEDTGWLVDLGFGSHGIREPMRLDQVNQPITQGYEQFMLSPEASGDMLVQALVKGAWAKQFSFNRCPTDWVDFGPANWYNSTSPKTTFTQRLVIVLFTATGRKSLFGDVLKIANAGQVTEMTIAPDQIDTVLAEEFNLIRPASN
jgi:N-hydroxyarylamine O-acetyltransferase